MRYAIIESGGKQYRAVEGELIEVDRLATEAGKEINLDRILLMADGDRFEVGSPTISGIEVKATVVEHISGPKVMRFKYSPKKRIRVRGGHRQQYTRLRVEFIGGKGESRPAAKAEAAPASAETSTAPVKPAPSKAPVKKAAAKKPAASK
ncbi:MAG TPA: 50S ribosomal protein L21, partial [Anaerolineales bacterium]|nr:50S ribosomal protein L21 [Anaerolineales bacterium]